jgi:hypothetical protein
VYGSGEIASFPAPMTIAARPFSAPTIFSSEYENAVASSSLVLSTTPTPPGAACLFEKGSDMRCSRRVDTGAFFDFECFLNCDPVVNFL